MTETQTEYLKLSAILKPRMTYAIEQSEQLLPELEAKLATSGKGTIRIEGTVNPGTKIVIKEMSKMISDPISRCKFVLKGADIKSIGI